jgi:hypothetical protein
MINKLILSIVFCTTLIFSNQYIEYYRPMGIQTQEDLCSNADSTPKVMSVPNVDSISLLNIANKGYRLLGYSMFDGDLNMGDMLEQARNIKANFVLYSNCSRCGKHRGVNIVGIPIRVNYDYQKAFYFRKSSFVLGARVMNIPSNYTKMLESNSGVLVKTVVPNSPAYNNNILVDDVILTLNGKDVKDDQTFIQTLKQYQNQTIKLHIFRNGDTLTVNVPLGSLCH